MYAVCLCVLLIELSCCRRSRICHGSSENSCQQGSVGQYKNPVRSTFLKCGQFSSCHHHVLKNFRGTSRRSPRISGTTTTVAIPAFGTWWWVKDGERIRNLGDPMMMCLWWVKDDVFVVKPIATRSQCQDFG